MTTQEKIDIWKAALEQQRHFNDMSARTRQIGLAFATAGIGLLIVLLQSAKAASMVIPIAAGWGIPLLSLVPIAIIFSLLGVAYLDIGVYHQLQRGAVNFTRAYEKEHPETLGATDESGTRIGMTQSITNASNQKGSKAATRLWRFYWICSAALFGLSVILFCALQSSSP